MTEADWNLAVDPVSIFWVVRHRATDRKHRLFSLACCHQTWDLFTDHRLRGAVELAEGLADGRVDEGRRATAECLTLDAWDEMADHSDEELAHSYHAAEQLVAAGKFTADVAARLAHNLALQSEWCDPQAFAGMADELQAEQCEFIRDIFGNPFRPVTLDPNHRTSTAVALATGVYEDRSFELLPILASAGCSDAQIPEHCRGGGGHWRGCWVVDLVLGKS